MKDRDTKVRCCAVIADDLTGACDAAIPFRARGISVYVPLDEEHHLNRDHDVVGVSTASRDLSQEEILFRIRRLAPVLKKWNPPIIFKKIDSTLRGNPGVEIAAAAEAWGFDQTVIVPAFPAMGRIVRDGHLHVEGHAAWEPVHVAEQLRAQGLSDCSHFLASEIASALQSGTRFVSVDACCQEDLQLLVETILQSKSRVLWAGSAGLSHALAAVLFPHTGTYLSVHPQGRQPVVFCIGSDHAVTVAQVQTLLAERPSVQGHVDTVTPEWITSCLEKGQHIVLNISRDNTHHQHLRRIFESVGNRMSALLISGGDTAALVCQALNTAGIQLEQEIVTGLPWGILKGGTLEGLPIATKSGGFGQPDALLKVADFFTCH